MATVAVTGVSSFVGFHLARHWSRQGRRVVGTISRPRDAYSGIEAERLAMLNSSIELVRLDLREPAAIGALVARIAPSLWVQHAGYTTDYATMAYNSDAAYAVNVAPLAPLYAALAHSGCGVLVTGSSAEYSSSDEGHREDDLCEPDTPYGLSKLTETLRARQLALQFRVPTRVARLYLPFGEADNPRKLLSLAVAKLRAGEAIDLSPCEQRRDFIGVADVCAVYDLMAADLSRTRFEVFNVGRGEAVRLRDLLEAVADRLHAPRSLLGFGKIPIRPGEALASYADIGKAKRLLGWETTPLLAAIDRDLLGAT